MEEYGVLYAKVVFPKNHRLFWLTHCYLSDLLPKDLQREITKLSSDINSKYQDSIVVPMDNLINPGCVTTPESIEEIANAVYQGMTDIFKRISGDENCIRLVYGIGEMDSNELKSIKSTHKIFNVSNQSGYYPIMIKVGHFLDYGSVGKSGGKVSYDPGIYKI